MPSVIFWMKKWMHDFHGLWQYPYCSIIPLILIFLCKLHSLLLQQLYIVPHSLPALIWQQTFFLLLEFLVRFGQHGDNQWELLLNTLRKRVNSTKTSIPSTSFAIILFLWSLFYCFFFIPMIRTMAYYLYSFGSIDFSNFLFVVNFPDWFLLLLSLNFYFSQFGLGYSSCTSF